MHNQNLHQEWLVPWDVFLTLKSVWTANLVPSLQDDLRMTGVTDLNTITCFIIFNFYDNFLAMNRIKPFLIALEILFLSWFESWPDAGLRAVPGCTLAGFMCAIFLRRQDCLSLIFENKWETIKSVSWKRCPHKRRNTGVGWGWRTMLGFCVRSDVMATQEHRDHVGKGLRGNPRGESTLDIWPRAVWTKVIIVTAGQRKGTRE